MRGRKRVGAVAAAPLGRFLYQATDKLSVYKGQW